MTTLEAILTCTVIWLYLLGVVISYCLYFKEGNKKHFIIAVSWLWPVIIPIGFINAVLKEIQK